MSKSKKIIFTVFVILLAFSLIAAGTSVSRVERIQAGRDATVYIGRAGVTFRSSFYSGSVKVSRKDSSLDPANTKMDFEQKFLDVRFTTWDGKKVTHIQGPIYIYFKLAGGERALWEDGRLSIFYFDPWKSNWRECRTFEVLDGEDLSVGCRILYFGLYGLARN